MKTLSARAGLLSALCGALTAGGLALAAAPAAAQTTVEEFTVMGRYGPNDNVRSLSQVVSYADLDLSTMAGQAELRHRVRLTARYLCDKLGENESVTGPAPTCRADAEQRAMAQANDVISHFPPRGGTWVAGPVWVGPYPPTWVQTYP